MAHSWEPSSSRTSVCSEPEFRSVVRELARASIDLIKDDELMTDPGYLPLETRVRVAMEEIHAAEQVTGRNDDVRVQHHR